MLLVPNLPGVSRDISTGTAGSSWSQGGLRRQPMHPLGTGEKGSTSAVMSIQSGWVEHKMGELCCILVQAQIHPVPVFLGEGT